MNYSTNFDLTANFFTQSEALCTNRKHNKLRYSTHNSINIAADYNIRMYIYTVLIAADTITCIINIGVYVALISVQKSINIHVHDYTVHKRNI